MSENKNQYSWKSEKHRLSLQSALKRNEMYQQVLGSFRNLQTWKFELWKAPKSSIFLSVLWFFLPWRVENGRSPEWLMSWVNVCSWQGHSCVKDLQILRPMKNGTVLLQTGAMAKPLLRNWVLILCAECVHRSFLPLDVYSLKTVPLQRLLLLRSVKTVSLIQMAIISPA